MVPSTDPLLMVNELLAGYFKTQLLYVAAKLELPDRIAAAPQTTTELAQVLPVDALSLRRLLRALITYGILEENEQGILGLTPVGALLQAGHPSLLRDYALLVGEQHYPAWGHLLHTIQTGQTGFEAAFGTPFFASLATTPEVGDRFDRLMSRGTRVAAEALRDGYDFSTHARVVDVGGGQGTLLITLLEAYPHLQGLLYESSAVVSAAQTAVEAAGLEDRCQILAGDFFEAIPRGGDLYLLSQVLHDWSDDQARQILTCCAEAMPADGVLLICELVLPEQIEPGAAPASQSERVVRQDLSMLVLMGGRERTQDEFRQLLASAGFRLERCLQTSTPRSLLVAHPTKTAC